MTKDAIIAEIRKLSAEEQHEIAEMLLEPTEEDCELTPEDIAVADAREKYAEEQPETPLCQDSCRVAHRTTAPG
ncbi:MAG: hypothetical protein ACOC2Q_02515 [Spirochaetota bacterium]